MLNIIIINGRLTKDPEIKLTKNGKAVLRFTLAVDRSYKNKDNEIITDFHQCVAYENNAMFISKFFKQGDGIIVSGDLRNTRFTTKEGVDVSMSEINVGTVSFPTGKPRDPVKAIAQTLGEDYED